jgi:hypothetical protein
LTCTFLEGLPVRFLLSLLLVSSIATAASAADPLPEELLEFDAHYLDTGGLLPRDVLPPPMSEWGVRIVNVRYIPGEGRLPARYDIVFNFTHDIPETYMSEFMAQFPPTPGPCSSIIFYALDNFDIPFARCPFYLSEGELTGKTGDSFKVSVLVDKAVLEKVKEKRVVLPGHGDVPPVYATGRFRVRPVLGAPNVGDYRGALILRVRS